MQTGKLTFGAQRTLPSRSSRLTVQAAKNVRTCGSLDLKALTFNGTQTCWPVNDPNTGLILQATATKTKSRPQLLTRCVGSRLTLELVRHMYCILRQQSTALQGGRAEAALAAGKGQCPNPSISPSYLVPTKRPNVLRMCRSLVCCRHLRSKVTIIRPVCAVKLIFLRLSVMLTDTLASIAGLTLSQIEKAGLLSKAENLGVLSAASST